MSWKNSATGKGRTTQRAARSSANRSWSISPARDIRNSANSFRSGQWEGGSCLMIFIICDTMDRVFSQSSKHGEKQWRHQSTGKIQWGKKIKLNTSNLWWFKYSLRLALWALRVSVSRAGIRAGRHCRVVIVRHLMAARMGRCSRVSRGLRGGGGDVMMANRHGVCGGGSSEHTAADQTDRH